MNFNNKPSSQAIITVWKILEKQKISKRWQEMVKEVHLKLLPTFKELMAWDFVYTGSFAEGVTGVNYSDLDIMYVQPCVASENRKLDDPNIHFKIQTDGIYTGFCLLESEVQSVNIHHGDVPYFICERFKHKWLLSNTSAKDMFALMLQWTDTIRIDRCHVQGPSVALDERFPFLRGFSIDGIDFVLALKCIKWPSVAEEWIYRERRYGWPSIEIINENHKKGCLVVPVGKKGSATENLEWRFSFSLVELQLIHSFTDTQIKCYALLKMLLKQILKMNTGNILSSYIMKTAMFWEIEESESSVWEPPVNLLYCVDTCLQRVFYWTERNHFPNYFIRNQNMLDGKFEPSDEELLRDNTTTAIWKRQNLKQCISDIRDNILSHIHNIPPFLHEFNPTCQVESTESDVQRNLAELKKRFHYIMLQAKIVDGLALPSPNLFCRTFDLFTFYCQDISQDKVKFYINLKIFYLKVLPCIKDSQSNESRYRALSMVKCLDRMFANVSDIYKDVTLACCYYILSDHESTLQITNCVVETYTSESYFQSREPAMPDICLLIEELPFLPRVLQTEVICHHDLSRSTSVPTDYDNIFTKLDPLLYAHLLRFLSFPANNQNIPQLEAIKGIQSFARLDNPSGSNAVPYNILGHCLHQVREPKRALQAFCKAFMQQRQSKATIWHIAVLLHKELWKERNNC